MEPLSSELVEAIQNSLKATPDLIAALDGLEPPRAPSERSRKIVAAILWHRKFILTYYIVLGIFVALTAGHGTHKRRIWRRRVATRERTTLASEPLSSSSTLRGNSTPPQKDDSETTPLLQPCNQPPSLWSQWRAFLMHQPRHIVALTSPVNVLPDNGTSLVVLVLLAVNLFYLFYNVPPSSEWVFILADRAGLLFSVNLPILYLLAAKTNQPLKSLTGWSYEGLNLFHRRLGEWMIAFSVIHMLGMFVVWYNLLRPLGFTFLRFLSIRVVFLGIAAALSYYIIYLSSTGWFRRLYYETFLGLHILFQLAALTFLFFHYPTARIFVMVSLAIFTVDRLIWRVNLSSRTFIASLEVAPDQQTVLVHCDVDVRPKWLGMTCNLRHAWLPGQHVFVTVPSMGFKYRFQSHPFTIASPAPPRHSTSQVWPLQLIIRAIDGFSWDLLHYARNHQHCKVILDGPYGGTEALEAIHHADRVCLVAGGSGIAVTQPLAWDLRVREDMLADAVTSLRTFYKDGHRSTPPLLVDGLQADPGDYTHLWIRQDVRHDKWITMAPKARAVNRQNTLFVSGREPSGDEVCSLITHTFDTREPFPHGGRPDVQTEIWDWVTAPKVTRSASSSSFPSCRSGSNYTADLVPRLRGNLPRHGDRRAMSDKVCVVVSGPDDLVRDVRSIAAQLVQDGWDVDVFVEKFGW